MSYVMPFGKYKGRLVSDIPSSYLEWLTTIDLSDALQEAVVEELRLRDYGYSDDPGEDKDDHAQNSRRKQTSHSATQLDVAAWYRRLSLEFHPDRGGSKEGMQAIHRAKELLEQML
jgi:hypothetical protein